MNKSLQVSPFYFKASHVIISKCGFQLEYTESHLCSSVDLSFKEKHPFNEGQYIWDVFF